MSLFLKRVVRVVTSVLKRVKVLNTKSAFQLDWIFCSFGTYYSDLKD